MIADIEKAEKELQKLKDKAEKKSIGTKKIEVEEKEVVVISFFYIRTLLFL